MKNNNEERRVEERRFEGIWIPVELWLCKNLNWIEKVMFLEIKSLSKNKEGCYASNKHFQKFIGRGETTISLAISKLKELKLVEESNFNGRKRFLKIQKDAFYKIKRMPFRKLKGYIYIDKQLDNQLEKVSKDTMETDVSNNVIFNSSFTKKIVGYWNEIEGVPHVKVNKRTKTIREIESFLKQIKNKSFLKNNLINPTCRRKNNIPLEDMIKFSYKRHLKNLALLYKGEYEPKSKSILPSSLLGLIYNPIGKASWLMQVMYNPPELISEKIKVKDHYPMVTKFFSNRLNGISSNNGLETKLIFGIRSIVEFQKRIPAKTLNVPKLNREFGSCLNLCKNYYDWLDHQDWIEEITPTCINTNNKLWKRFIKEMEEEDCEGYKLQ